MLGKGLASLIPSRGGEDKKDEEQKQDEKVATPLIEEKQVGVSTNSESVAPFNFAQALGSLSPRARREKGKLIILIHSITEGHERNY